MMTRDWHIAYDNGRYRVEGKADLPNGPALIYQPTFLYRFAADGVVLAEGNEFKPAPAHRDYLDCGRMTEQAAVNLMGFFAQDAESLRMMREDGSEWVTDELIDWAEAGGYDDLSLVVHDYEMED